MNIAERERLAVRCHTCPTCGAVPRRRCAERSKVDPARHSFLARPHQTRVELVTP